MRLIKYLIILGILLIGLVVFFVIRYKEQISEKIQKIEYEESKERLKISEPPQISGWVAWWKEKEAYDLIQKYPSRFNSISPVWFFINNKRDLINVGEVYRQDVVNDMKDMGILLVPCLGSGLGPEELSLFLNDMKKVDSLIDNLVFQLVALETYGVDIDLEGIKKEDKNAFNQFLFKLKSKLKEHDIKLYVAIHAQTEKVEWEGVLGQDLKAIGEIADYVRIMTYDKHSASTEPGAISPIGWMKDVAYYNQKFIDRQKVVIGIPTYSYVWTKDDCIGRQFDELNQYLQGKTYTQKRDKESKELIYRSNEFEAWLSDSEAMIRKIENLRDIGFNNFVIWSLGGMDEKFFEKNWQ